MMNIVLYFDSNGEMGSEFLGYAAYEGKNRVRSIIEDTYELNHNDPEYASYTSYTYKLEALRSGLESLYDYVSKNKARMGELNIICCSQHTPINDMVYSGTENSKYIGKLEEIEDLIISFDNMGIGVGITYVPSSNNKAKDNVTKMLKNARLQTRGLNKSLDNNVNKMKSIADRVKKRNVEHSKNTREDKKVNIQRFKI